VGFGAGLVSMENTASPLGFIPQTIQPVANSYTNYAILAPLSVLQYPIIILHVIYFSTYSIFPYEDRRFISPLSVQPVSSPLNSIAVMTSHDICSIILNMLPHGDETDEEILELWLKEQTPVALTSW